MTPLEQAQEIIQTLKYAVTSCTPDRGPVTLTPTANPCKRCNWNDMAAGKAGRCNTCSAHWYKHGVERPLDQDRMNRVEDARAAQRRARARGEGWGEA